MRIFLPNRWIGVQMASVMSLVLLTSSCVTDKDFLYLNDQIVALNKRVDGLSKEMVSVREEQARAEEETKRAREEMQAVQGRLEENNRLVRRTVEKDTRTQNGLSAGVTDLRLRIERLETDVKRLNAYLNLEPAGPPAAPKAEEKPAAPIAKPEPPAPAPAPAGRAPEPVREKPEGPPVVSEQQLYESSMAFYRQEKYEEAIAGFRNFVSKYPKSELADNAQFWEGEAHMALKQYEQAILAFQKVIKNYPKGNKVPNAILRQALAFYEINDKTSCKLLLKKLVTQYPTTNEAKIAGAKLKTMK